jgi:hypothetical protein
MIWDLYPCSIFLLPMSLMILHYGLRGDGLAGGPGRAFDLFLGGKFPVLENFHIKGGYRFLEGGADVSEVYNFTVVNFVVLGLIWEITI